MGGMRTTASTTHGPTINTVMPARSRRIRRKEYLQPASLCPSERSALADRLYPVLCETMSGFARNEFEEHVFARGVRVGLFYGADGELAGFTYAGLDRVEHESRNHAIFSMGTFFRPGYHGGVQTALFGFRVALRFKLREPRTPMSYLTRSVSPASYRRMALVMPTLYPHSTRQTPAGVEALVGALIARWQYHPVAQDSWVVRSIATPHTVSRLRRIADDPETRFYLRLNPRFADGESLVVFIPLNTANIVGGLFRATCARGRRR
ncbi:hypothetical protein [Mycobacterium sp. SMC-15]|uniref:hypothetical protein n=1 Tax=Mycobacterium sp. SMC-15 TaxID=3381627 RepID=UPI003876F9D6